MAPSRPNVVFIMADDLGYGDLGCYNPDSKIPTPNLDALAAGGALFSDAHSSSAVCTPSRYSVLTGRYCWRTRLQRRVDGGFSTPLIDTTRETMATLMKRAGYRTAAVGKWHVGMTWQPKRGEENSFHPENWADEGHVDYTRPILDGPLQHGFDSHFSIAGSLDMPPYCFIENGRTVGIPDVPKKVYYPQQKEGFQTPDWDDREVDLTFTRKACERIDAWVEESADPFFLYLTPAAPHRPCVPPEFARGKSKAGNRGDMVWLVDWMVGQVKECLERNGVLEKTMIVFTSDNGARPGDVDGELWDHLSCGNLRGYKGDIWDGGHRVPLLVHYPEGVRGGQVCAGITGIFDTIATVRDLLGMERGENQMEDAVSYLPQLMGAEGLREGIVHHSCDGMFALRQGPWKLACGLGSGNWGAVATSCPDGPEGQLYDLTADLAERRNRWLEMPEKVEAMQGLLESCRRETSSLLAGMVRA